MASNRSNLKSRSALAAVARDGVRNQIAALTAVGKAITGAHAADRFDARLSRVSIDN